MTLATLLAPHDKTVFLQEVLGQSALQCTGASDRFSGVFSWAALNHLMKFGRLAGPRLHLFRDGKELPSDAYFADGSNGFPRLIVAELNSALREGATLAIESIEDLHESISILCEDLEKDFEIPVQADLYANWKYEKFSVLRRNEHDVIVLQIEGSRALRIYYPTIGHLTPQNWPPEPTGSPAWDGVLQQGEVIYLPKGWWYCDRTDEPALSVVVKFRNPTAADALRGAFEILVSSNEIQRDFPRFGGPESQNAFIKSFHDGVSSVSTMPGLVVNFLRDFRTFAEPRIGFNFPWSAMAVPLPPSEEFLALPLVRFPNAESVRHALDEDAVLIAMGSRLIRCSPETGRLFAYICARPASNIRTLRQGLANEIPEDRLSESLSELVRNGLVELREPAANMTTGTDCRRPAG